MADIKKTLEENLGKTLSAGAIIALLPIFAFMEDRYVNAGELADYQQQTQKAVDGNRVKYLEDQIFILDFKANDPTEDKNLNRALKERYKNELREYR